MSVAEHPPWRHCQICGRAVPARFTICKHCRDRFLPGITKARDAPDWLEHLEAQRKADQRDPFHGVLLESELEHSYSDGNRDDEPLEDQTLIDQVQADSDTSRALLADEIEALLEAATPAQRAIILAYLQGLGPREIQRELGYSSPGTVTKQLSRLRDKAAKQDQKAGDARRWIDRCCLCDRRLKQAEYTLYRYLCDHCASSLPLPLAAALKREALERRHRAIGEGSQRLQPPKHCRPRNNVPLVTLPQNPAPYPTDELNRQYRQAHGGAIR